MTQASKPLLCLRGEGDLQREWVLDKSRITIGRDESNDIVLAAAEVSRRHAIMHQDRGRWFIEDQQSSNGTFIHDEPLEGPRLLQDGDQIRIATLFRLFFVDCEVTVQEGTCGADQALFSPLPGEKQPNPPDPEARIEHTPALLDPFQPDTGAPKTEQPVSAAPRLVIEHKTRRIWIAGRELTPPLSASQYAVLELLYQRVGELVSREDISRKVWPTAQTIVSEQAIDSLIWRLRRRIEAIDPHHEYIITVRGHGVRLECAL